MTEKRFELRLCSNGVYYLWNNNELTDIDFDKFNKESANEIINLLNQLNDENEKLKDEVYDELDNALTVLTELYEVIPISSQSKMNSLYNRLKSLRDDIK